jgi:TatD DNase family protein
MLVDSHSHLDAAEFDADRAQVIERARRAGVLQQIVPAVTAAGWPALKTLCASAPGLHPGYGLHPTFLRYHRDEQIDELREWLARERPCCVGECGLDYHVEGLDLAFQRRLFQAQLELAKEFDLPVVVHALRAVDDVVAMLRKTGGLRGVVHSFGGSPEQARQLFKLGFHLGIGGPVTYARAKRLRGLVATMPIEFLLLETDSPDQPLQADRGRRNEPARLAEVAQVVADLRGVASEEIARATTSNARRLFGLPTQEPPPDASGAHPTIA